MFGPRAGTTELPLYSRRESSMRSSRSGLRSQVQRLDCITKAMLLLTPVFCLTYMAGIGIVTHFIDMDQSREPRMTVQEGVASVRQRGRIFEGEMSPPTLTKPATVGLNSSETDILKEAKIPVTINIVNSTLVENTREYNINFTNVTYIQDSMVPGGDLMHKEPMVFEPSRVNMSSILKTHSIVESTQNRKTKPSPVNKRGLIDEKYVDGTWTADERTPEEQIKAEMVALDRAKSVKASMKHAWSNYRKYAFGMDEVLPISKKGGDCWGGMAATLIDALDTLWIMGMQKEFTEGRNWLEKHQDFFLGDKSISVFEMTIRDLGGLLSAYDLSKDKLFLDVATTLGDLLFQAFDTTDGTGLPMNILKNGKPVKITHWPGPDVVILSEAGSLQVEFRYLSHATGDPKYAIAANNVYDVLYKQVSEDGLYPTFLSRVTGIFTTRDVSIGAFGDSFYEYIMKTWLQGGKSEVMYREMYDKAIDGIENVLLQKASLTGLTYIATGQAHSLQRKMEHLVCFLPGTLALGAYNSIDQTRAKRDMTMAKALMYTCYMMYRISPSGLSPDNIDFDYKNFDSDGFSQYDMHVPVDGRSYKLRPEVAESLFVLHQLTGDPTYREWSWEIFQAIEKKCKVGGGYGHYHDVLDDSPGAEVEDKMESFFLAETLKYLYLIHDSSKPIDLTKHVFNTEAHPLSMFGSNSIAIKHRPPT